VTLELMSGRSFLCKQMGNTWCC